MLNCDYKTLFEEAAAQFQKGVFLMVKGNPMTIAWCQMGEIWGKSICTVLVRHSRHTHTLMESSETFTVSVPHAGTMKEALAFCGTKSGRDIDKCAALGLSLLPSQTGGTDGLAGCAMHFECRIVSKTEMDLTKTDPAILAKLYGSNQATADGDPHTIYFGEIVAAYRE